MKIPDIEHISFIEGLLFYIAMRLGDKDSLMDWLQAWNKEYEKREFEGLSGGNDDD